LARQVQKSASGVIVYDDELLDPVDSYIFDSGYWQGAESLSGYAGGRGTTLFIELAGVECVLRHYYRGGLVGKVLSDQFLWMGAARIRSVREWDLLHDIAATGLPAPVPVAARYVRHGAWYTADLITRRIPAVTPFSRWLEQDNPARDMWQRVGKCIATFHAAGFCHADLNAHNLQISASGDVFLLDWDRGTQQTPGKWRNANLARLHRSCKKISRAGHVKFVPGDWEALLAGYYQI
jgi:3-deoxy-D-manno-octulosonic acid kinase